MYYGYAGGCLGDRSRKDLETRAVGEYFQNCLDFHECSRIFLKKRRLLLIEKRLLLLPTQMRRIYTFFSSLNAEQRTSLLPYFLPIYFIAINFFCDYKERFN